MTRLLLVLLLLLPVPAMAAEWGHYANARFGYGIDVPPGFVAGGEADNGDGQVFRTPTATLTVFGGNVTATDIESEAVARESFTAADGWSITYRVSTPQGASWSGRRGGRVLYARLVALCGGTQFASFALEYSRADQAAFDPIVTRLVRSLRGSGGGSC